MLHIDHVATNGIRGGGADVWASQNVQFECVTPTVSTMQLPETEILARVNTTTVRLLEMARLLLTKTPLSIMVSIWMLC